MRISISVSFCIVETATISTHTHTHARTLTHARAPKTISMWPRTILRNDGNLLTLAKLWRLIYRKRQSIVGVDSITDALSIVGAILKLPNNFGKALFAVELLSCNACKLYNKFARAVPPLTGAMNERKNKEIGNFIYRMRGRGIGSERMRDRSSTTEGRPLKERTKWLWRPVCTTAKHSANIVPTSRARKKTQT